MKILILSDNHSKVIDFDTTLFDVVIHCGDYGRCFNILDEDNILFVRGNCDLHGDEEINKEIANKNIFITHGNRYDVKYTLNYLIEKAKIKNVNYCFYGHTHKQDYFICDGITFINPGTYEHGYYAIIENNKLKMYKDKKVLQKFDLNW